MNRTFFRNLLIIILTCVCPSSGVLAPLLWELTQIQTSTPSMIASFQESCEIPCWEYIRPGKTTIKDANRILNRLMPDRVKKIDRLGSWYYVSLTSGNRISIVFEEGIVSSIDIHEDRISGLCLWQVIEQFGEPEAVSNSQISAPQCPTSQYIKKEDAAGKYTRYMELLLYPQKGLVVVFEELEGFKGCVHPDFHVGYFIYFEPNSIEEAMKTPHHPMFLGSTVGPGDIVPWHGFGPWY